MHVPRSRPFAVIAALWVSALAGTAAADLPPPAGYVETCTTDKQAKPGTECLSCAAYHGNSQHCSASLATYGFAKSCKSRGASVWSEVWCRPAKPDAAKVPAEVLAQLGDANGHPPAASSAAPVATTTPTPNLPASPLPSATTAAAPTSQPESGGPAPQPLPPHGGCACSAAGAEMGVPALMLALCAGAAGAARRRRSRRPESP